MSNKKKVIVMSSLVLLLAAPAVFNFVLANTTSEVAAEGGVTTANYFTTYRAERTSTRNEELIQLDSVIALYEEGDEKYVSLSAVALSGTEGEKYKHIISGVTFDTEEAYNIKMNLSDSYGYSTVYMLVNSMFIPIDMTPNGENMSFGAPAKETTQERGMFRIEYTNIDLAPKNRLLYKGEVMFGQKQLWPTTNQTGSSVMNETHSITLSKKISEMKNGILLVFGRDGNYGLSAHFVPKQSVVSFGRAGWTFMLCTDLFDYIGAKTLYISDTKIEGHTNNDATAKNGVSGITYHNEAFYLKYVYEV